MGRDTSACRMGRGGSSGRGGRGRGGRGRGASATVPREASEVGACKDLEGHIFSIGSGRTEQLRKLGNILFLPRCHRPWYWREHISLNIVIR